MEQADAVLALTLGQVQRLIGTRDQRGRILAVHRKGGDPSGQAHLDVLAVDRVLLEAAPDALTDPLGHRVGSQPIGLGQDHGELLAPVTTRRIGVTDRTPQLPSHALQDLVAEQMSVAIVESFECVEIEHEQGEPQGITMAPSHLESQCPGKVTPVVQSRQRVGQRGTLRFLQLRTLHDRGVGQQLLDVREVVDRRDAKARIAPQGATEIPAVAQQIRQQALGLDFGDLEVGQYVQRCGVDPDPLGLPELVKTGQEQIGITAIVGQQCVDPLVELVAQPWSRHKPPLPSAAPTCSREKCGNRST
jgi:hypothetical protein